MKQLLSGSYYQFFGFFMVLFNLIFIFLFSSCGNNFGLGVERHCNQYTYNKEKQIWTDLSGQQVSCTIVDNERVFAYYPDQGGCNYWKKFYSDETIQFLEVPIRLGSGEYSIAQKYCVKQRYISTDNSDQVLLIDEGVFCLAEHPDPEIQKEYVFTSCEGVQRKSQDSKKSKK